MASRRVWSSVLFGMLLLFAANAGAKPKPPVATAAPTAATPPAPPPLAEALTGEAKSNYDGARILYDDHDYPGALGKLKVSYELSNDPRLLWNMAACEKNLRHYAAVLDLIDRYLATGGDVLTASDRTEATNLASVVADFVSTLTVTANEAGANVYFDDELKGTTPLPAPLRVDMGKHRVRVTKPGFADFSAAPELLGGQASTVEATLTAVRHEGQLRVVAGPQDVIQVDGKTVGTGLWNGTLPSGSHAVFVSAKGKLSHQTEVNITDAQVNTLHVTLQNEPKPAVVDKSGVPVWLWVAGGAVVAGAGVGAYFLFKPGDTQYQPATEGSWGAISLP